MVAFQVFMLAVLGSTIFWVCYISISFIASVSILNKFDNDFLRPFIEGKSVGNKDKDADFESYFGSLIILVVTIILWPCILIAYLLHWMFIYLIVPGVSLLVRSSIKATPNISIEVNKEK